MLKKYATRVYPRSLKEVKAKKYKLLDFDGYFLLDDTTSDSRVPNLFYYRKWRQTDLSVVELLKRVRNRLKQDLHINVSRIEKINEAPASYTFSDASMAYYDFKESRTICTAQQQKAINLSEFDDLLLMHNIVLGYE